MKYDGAGMFLRDVIGFILALMFGFLFAGAGVLGILHPPPDSPFLLLDTIAGFGFALFLIAGSIRDFVNSLRYKDHCRKAEFSNIVNKCCQHPDKDFQDVVCEAVRGAKYWTFKMVWKKLRDSHDYGRVFTGIFR